MIRFDLRLSDFMAARRSLCRKAAHGTGRSVLIALAAAAMLLTAVDVDAQRAQRNSEPDAEAAAAARAAEERARAEAEAAAIAKVFTDFSQQIRELREAEAEVAEQREAAAERELADQEQLAREAVQRRDAAEARSAELDARWESNEAAIADITALLRQHEGNLGELFGVTRQIAGDAAGVLSESLISTQFEPAPGAEERADFMRRIAAATALPSIDELKRLWFELTREMTEAGRVMRYPAPVIQLDGTVAEAEVVRVGPFVAVSDGQFLGYLPSETSLSQLDGQLATSFRQVAASLQNTPPDAGYTRAVVDPASGSLLGLYLERPGVMERIENGEVVGYVIIAVGVLGVLLALFQYGYLLKTRIAVTAQLRDLAHPKSNNPLGRLLLAFRSGNGAREDAELAELRLSEAVLREVPKLERFQSFLRLAVAAGPLLGLIGTVIGMIVTFHAITASGSSDPKLMAHGIGQAMIATVLGLGIAIPLLFINAGLTAISRGITQLLDEQSQSLLAENLARQE